MKDPARQTVRGPDRARVLEIFFGCTETDLTDDVILTPIPAFYRALLNGADEVIRRSGWWSLARVTRGGRNYCVVQHFEGTRVVDPVRALTREHSRFAFLGLVGGVDPEARIGRMVRIVSASRVTGAVASCVGAEKFGAPGLGADRFSPDFLPVRALTVNGLLDDPVEVCASARRLSASVVDLETYFFFEALGLAGPAQGLALGLVTDRPGVAPFWTVPVADSDLAAVGAEMASTVLKCWLSIP